MYVNDVASPPPHLVVAVPQGRAVVAVAAEDEPLDIGGGAQGVAAQVEAESKR